MKHLPALALLFMVIIYTQAQPWHKPSSFTLLDKKDISPNFRQQQQNFNAYWEARIYEKGKGYKQFRRYESFVAQRIYPLKNFPAQAYWLAASTVSTDSVYKTEWTSLGPDNTPLKLGKNIKAGNGRTNCIAFHPSDPQTFWVGTPSGGLWKTTNGGSSYYTTTDTLGSLGVSDIAVHPTNPDIIYIATGDGDGGNTYSIGILKSVDGGHHWQTTSVSMQPKQYIVFRRICMHRSNPNYLIATSSNGIYYTTDGWNTFFKCTDEFGEPLTGQYRDLEFHPTNPDIVYATYYDVFNYNSEILKSTDGGKTFYTISEELNLQGNAGNIELAVTPDYPDKLLAIIANSLEGYQGFYVSTNKGETWLTINTAKTSGKNLLGYKPNGNDIGGQAWYDLSLAVSPVNHNEIIAGGVNLWKSDNGGVNWYLIGHYNGEVAGYIHADHHMLNFNPINLRLYSCNDGGLHYLNKPSNTWTDISSGLSILQTYRISVSQTRNPKILTGNQDNGILRFQDSAWTEVLYGDGMNCAIDNSNNEVFYSALNHGKIYRSNNSGNTYTSIIPSVDLTGNWITPFVLSQQWPNTILAGYNNLYISYNRGDNWIKISDNLTNDNLDVIAISNSSEQCIFVSSGHRLFKTLNRGNTWSEITQGLPDVFISDIEVSPTNPEQLWVSFSGFIDGEKIYVSDNGGKTWINCSGRLPNIPVNCIEVQKNANELLYIGTDIGVYYRHRGLDKWVRLGGKLPNVIVSDIDVNYPSGEVYVATFGRGIWKAPAISDFGLNINFTTSHSIACTNFEMQLNYTGSANYDSLRWTLGNTANTPYATTPTTGIWYSSPGKKTISLQVFKNGTSYVETKENVVEVIDQLDFSLNKDNYFTCTDSVFLELSPNYNYSLKPNIGAQQLAPGKVSVLPDSTITFEITALQGTCIDTDSLVIYRMTNDSACHATALLLGKNGPFAIGCASAETNEPIPPAANCYSNYTWCSFINNIDHSLWYTVKATESGILQIDCRGFDSQIALYEANSCHDLTLENYTLLAANDDCNSQETGSTIIVNTGLVAGNTYWLQVHKSNMATDSSFYINVSDNTTGENMLNYITHGLDIYPNPVHNEIFLQTSETISNGTLLIYNSQGKMVLYRNNLIIHENNPLKISLNSMNSGIYFVNLIEDVDLYKYKLIVD